MVRRASVGLALNFMRWPCTSAADNRNPEALTSAANSAANSRVLRCRGSDPDGLSSDAADAVELPGCGVWYVAAAVLVVVAVVAAAAAATALKGSVADVLWGEALLRSALVLAVASTRT